MDLLNKSGLFAMALMCNVTTVFAQATRATVSGKVVDDKGQPVIGAMISVKNESTGFKVSAPTGPDGTYNIREVPLGSPYTVSAHYMGMGDQVRTGYALNQGDALRVDFTMTQTATQLHTVEVVANSLRKGVEYEGAATKVSSQDIAKLPVNGRNFTSLMDLSPLSSGGNIGGQLGSSTNYTVDGMTAKGTVSGGSTMGAYTMSMEAVREFQVVSNAYDVTYGRSGGGTVSAVTKSGTNTLTGGVFTYGRANWMSSPYNINGNKIDSKYSTFQYGFSLGGPIIKDRLHFYVVWDHQRDSRPIYIANLKSDKDIARYNVTQQTLDDFLQVAREKYGVANTPQFGEFGKTKQTDAVFARLDWQINPNNLLTVRNNYINERNPLSESDNTAINLYEVWINRKNYNNSFMTSLRSILNPQMTNELKLQHFVVYEGEKTSTELPSTNIPRAIVQKVESTGLDGKPIYTSIQLGGQRYAPENFKDHVLQLVDNLYLNTKYIDWTFGADFMYTHMNSQYGSEMNGRFYFNGMDNFKNMTPYRYAREVMLTDDPFVKMNTLNSAVYGQMKTHLATGLELMAGIRFDYTRYFNHAHFNKLVYDQLGLRTDNVISTFQPQPRIQFTWDINDEHNDILKWGAGIFGTDINNYLMINNILFDGTREASVDIQDPALLPKPDFIGYRKNPASAPGKDLFNNPNIKKIATINTNGKDARVPVIYKANLSYTHYFSDRLRLGVSFYGSWTRHNYMYLDRNMVDKPYFTLANEANRGVFVPAESINTTNGATDWMQGRKTKDIGRVLELVSNGRNNQYAFVIDGTYRYFKDGQISFSYTWNDTKDNVSYNGNVANSATLFFPVKSDPRDLSRMDYSDNQFRHKVVVYGTAPTFWGITVGLRFSGIGGTRYSLAVNGNVNGDFVDTNDLAYVYNPNDASTPQYLKDGINAILNNPDASSSVKKYIRKSFGKIADRNGGINGFYGTFDLHLGKRFKLYKTHHLDVSVDLFNVANLLNKDWGAGQNLGKIYLYNIKGFDAQKKEYIYTVNTNAGVPAGNGNPYQFQIGLRYGF